MPDLYVPLRFFLMRRDRQASERYYQGETSLQVVQGYGPKLLNLACCLGFSLECEGIVSRKLVEHERFAPKKDSEKPFAHRQTD